MSKFKDFAFSVLLTEYDRDDPTDNFWQAAKDYKRMEKEKLYSKPINPLKNDDKVFIKVIIVDLKTSNVRSIMYLTGKEDFPYTYDRKKAKVFNVSEAEEFVKRHPKETIDDFGRKYEKHFEIEKP